MIAIRRAWEADDQRAKDLGLSPEETAFYDVVQTLKSNLKIDWTEPSREEIRAIVRSAVNTVLRKKKVREEDLEPFLGSVMVWRCMLSDRRSRIGPRILNIEKLVETCQFNQLMEVVDATYDAITWDVVWAR